MYLDRKGEDIGTLSGSAYEPVLVNNGLDVQSQALYYITKGAHLKVVKTVSMLYSDEEDIETQMLAIYLANCTLDSWRPQRAHAAERLACKLCTAFQFVCEY